MKKPTEKVTPIKELERLMENPVKDTGVAISENPPPGMTPEGRGECSCSCRAATERASGRVILRCPECGLIRDIWRGADQLPAGSYCRWCGLEDPTISMGICADRACHPRRR